MRGTGNFHGLSGGGQAEVGVTEEDSRNKKRWRQLICCDF